MPARLIDLHTHSTASDGTASPSALVAMAKLVGLSALALTDHDTVAGIAEADAAAQVHGISFVPGVEISAQYDPGTMHILGLFIDADSEPLREVLARYQKGRAERNCAMVAKLNRLGIQVTMAEWTQRASGTVGRPHLAGLLVEKGCVQSKQEAFAKYLAKGASAYIDRQRLSPRAAIEAIHAASGVAVLAHPVQLRCENYAQCERIIKELRELGLDGIEVYHSEHNAQKTRYFAELARKMSLLPSGGSDFHGNVKPNIALGGGAGQNCRVPYQVYENLRDAATKRVSGRECQ